LEEDLLKIFDEVEGVDKELKETKALMVAEEKKFKDTQAQLNTRINDIDAQIKNLNDKRSVFIKDIDANTLSRYEKLLETRAGLAITAVDTERENCGACHIRVTPQTINEIKMYKNLVLCESCVRILYVNEDTVL
jgi:predicted  nucleic acid-binding Zn-ribbon protein